MNTPFDFMNTPYLYMNAVFSKKRVRFFWGKISDKKAKFQL